MLAAARDFKFRLRAGTLTKFTCPPFRLAYAGLPAYRDTLEIAKTVTLSKVSMYPVIFNVSYIHLKVKNMSRMQSTNVTTVTGSSITKLGIFKPTVRFFKGLDTKFEGNNSVSQLVGR